MACDRPSCSMRVGGACVVEDAQDDAFAVVARHDRDPQVHVRLRSPPVDAAAESCRPAAAAARRCRACRESSAARQPGASLRCRDAAARQGRFPRAHRRCEISPAAGSRAFPDGCRSTELNRHRQQLADERVGIPGLPAFVDRTCWAPRRCYCRSPESVHAWPGRLLAFRVHASNARTIAS